MTEHTDKRSLLKIEHLTMHFGGVVAISDVSFDIFDNEITALIGPNGAGKTTLFNCLTGFYRPTSGRLMLKPDGQKPIYLERLATDKIAAKAKVARTFQNIRLFAKMTVLENLLVAQHGPLMRASKMSVAGVLGLSSFRRAEKAAVEKSRHYLEKLDLIDVADVEAGSLPYGAQRRLEIARSMCLDPCLLCLDEPAAGLNPRESAKLNELLQFLRQDQQIAIILIEHDMSVVMNISDHVIVIDYGKKIADGDVDHVKNDKRVIAAYLGENGEDAA